jgi:hypothetical protein
MRDRALRLKHQPRAAFKQLGRLLPPTGHETGDFLSPGTEPPTQPGAHGRDHAARDPAPAAERRASVKPSLAQSLLLFHVAVAEGRAVRCLRGERPSVGEDADCRRRGRQALSAAVGAARRDRRSDRRNGVGSPVDPYRLGDTMSTRTIAIVALVIAVVIVVVLFVI